MQRHVYSTPTDQDPPVDYRPEELSEALAESPLFDAMPDAEVLEVARSFDEQRFNSGHRITLEGLRGTDFFIILEGHARVSVDGRTVGHLRRGDFFGELGVLGDGLRFATVTAETPLHCLVLPHGELKPLLVDHPQMSINVLGEVVNRFQDLAERRQAEKWGLSAG
jgi:CRP-like cAMP-binding protein